MDWAYLFSFVQKAVEKRERFFNSFNYFPAGLSLNSMTPVKGNCIQSVGERGIPPLRMISYAVTGSRAADGWG
jgi:hypothetical protein